MINNKSTLLSHARPALYGVLFIKSLAWVVSPLTGLLFPTIEDVLKEQNISTEILDDLGVKDKHIRVRTLNAWGYAHIALSGFQGVYNIYKSVNNEKKRLRGFAQGNNDHTLLANEIMFGMRINVIETSKTKGNEFYSAEQADLHILFHELRHLSGKNRGAGFYASEMDAEHYGSIATAKVTNDPNFVHSYMLHRSLTMTFNFKGYNKRLIYGLQVKKPSLSFHERNHAYSTELYKNGL